MIKINLNSKKKKKGIKKSRKGDSIFYLCTYVALDYFFPAFFKYLNFPC